MKTLVVATSIILIIGLIVLGYIAFFPAESSKIGPPVLSDMGPNLPMEVFVPVTNIGRPVNNLGPGTIQVAMSIWGSPSDVVGSSLEGRTILKSDQETRAYGPLLARIGATYYVSPSRIHDPNSNNLLLGEIARKRKHPVHVGFGWRRDKLEGAEDFIIPPGKNVVIAVPSPKP